MNCLEYVTTLVAGLNNIEHIIAYNVDKVVQSILVEVWTILYQIAEPRNRSPKDRACLKLVTVEEDGFSAEL